MKSRKSNRSKQVAGSCRNNGSCDVCRGDRLHSTERQTTWLQGLDGEERQTLIEDLLWLDTPEDVEDDA